MPRESYAFSIGGIAPPDLDDYGLSAARQFWRWVVEIGLRVKDASLAAGRGRNGRKLRAIAESTRKHRRSWTGEADPDAPPLTPAYAGSRTRALLAGRAMRDRAEFFWKADPVTGKPWGRILGYHRKGFRGTNRAGRKQFLPVRDVIGMSAADTNSVKRESLERWEKFKADREAERNRFRPGRLTLPKPALAPGPKPPPPKKVVPKIDYLGKATPRRPSRKIQVYEE